ncbi:Group-specific protein [Bacillus luti]
MMCEISIENDEALISFVVYYNETEDEYIAIEDIVRKVEMPLSITIDLTINEEPKSLSFTADKVDIYKNSIKINLN